MEELKDITSVLEWCEREYDYNEGNTRSHCAVVGTSNCRRSSNQAREFVKLKSTYGRFGLCEVSRPDEQDGWD
jgi:hypothetical protein